MTARHNMEQAKTVGHVTASASWSLLVLPETNRSPVYCVLSTYWAEQVQPGFHSNARNARKVLRKKKYASKIKSSQKTQ